MIIQSQAAECLQCSGDKYSYLYPTIKLVHISEQKFSWTILIEPPSTDEDERAEENLSQQVSRDLSEATG